MGRKLTEAEMQIKNAQLDELRLLDEEYTKCVKNGNMIVAKFMDMSDFDNIELKIKVLQALNKGEKLENIKGYEKVVKVPKGVWD